MNAPLACPHCKSVLPPNPPGVFHCGRCGKPFTVPGPQDLAREDKKRQDQKLVIMIVGAVVFLFYVAPVLLTFGYMCFVMVVYVLMAIGFGIGAAAG